MYVQLVYIQIVYIFAKKIPKGIEDTYQRERDFNTNNILM